MKTNRTLLQLSFVLICFITNAQSTFEVVNLGNQYSSEMITSAFTNANFCGSYFDTKRNLITLNDGSKIELKSYQELLNEGIDLGESCIKDANDRVYDWIWSIDPSGILLKGFDSNLYSSEKEYLHHKNSTNQ